MTSKNKTEQVVDPILLEKAKEVGQEKAKKTKRINANADLIKNRQKRVFEIPVITDETEDEIIETIFKARRLTPRERAEMTMLNIDTNNIAELSEEELAELEKQSYELLSKVIVTPDYSAEEWQQVDIALTQELVNKITFLQYEANDAKAIESFRN